MKKKKEMQVRKRLFLQEIMFWVFVAGLLVTANLALFAWTNAKDKEKELPYLEILAHACGFMFAFGLFTAWYFLPFLG